MGDFDVATGSATAGVCTITVFLVPVETQPAAFPTTRTEMPPMTAATIATIAREAGRSRTYRTVAAFLFGHFTGKIAGSDRACPAAWFVLVDRKRPPPS